MVVGQFGRIFLQVDVIQFYSTHHRSIGRHFAISRVGPGIQRHLTTDAERQVQLAGLVILGHIGIEVILTIPLGNRWGAATQHHASEYCTLNGKFIQDRQSSGHSQTGGAHVRVGVAASLQQTAAEHLRPRLQLDVRLKPYRVLEFHRQFP